MNAIQIQQDPLAAHVVADVTYRVRKGKPPKDNPLAAIWTHEQTVGWYYEVTATDHNSRKAVFYIIPVATQDCMQGGVSYAADGIGGVVYLQSERQFIGVETGVRPNGFAVVTLLFRMNNQQTDLYSFTAKFDPV